MWETGRELIRTSVKKTVESQRMLELRQKHNCFQPVLDWSWLVSSHPIPQGWKNAGKNIRMLQQTCIFSQKDQTITCSKFKDLSLDMGSSVHTSG